MAEEAPQDLVLEAFWVDLDLILDAFGGHCAALFVSLFVVLFWSGCGVAFSSMWGQFCITFWSQFGAFLGSRLKSANEALAWARASF